MPRIKQVLRCYAAGKGTKSISSLMDLSRTTVKKYINTFNQCGKSIEEVLAMDETELLRLFNEKPDPRPLLSAYLYFNYDGYLFNTLDN